MIVADTTLISYLTIEGEFTDEVQEKYWNDDTKSVWETRKAFGKAGLVTVFRFPATASLPEDLAAG